eukprot:scaffold17466_cov20-Tisochrysis_lutea.AAC.1
MEDGCQGLVLHLTSCLQPPWRSWAVIADIAYTIRVAIKGRHVDYFLCNTSGCLGLAMHNTSPARSPRQSWAGGHHRQLRLMFRAGAFLLRRCILGLHTSSPRN